jgi:uncharacterized membrane protein YgcG
MLNSKTNPECKISNSRFRSRFSARNFIIAAGCILAGVAAASPAFAITFDSFEQQVAVGPDSMLTVRETVRADFDVQRHGIYRDLPVKYKTQSGNPFSLRVKVMGVTDENGEPIEYTTSTEDDRFRIKIGDPAVYVIGPHTYVITYSVARALLYFDDHDELYWNVVTEAWGDLGWPEKLSTTVLLPGQAAAADIKTRCFTNAGVGAPENCETTVAGSSVKFTAPNGYLTVVVGWPPGIVAKPTAASYLADWLRDNWVVIIPIFAFAILYVRWRKHGKEPERKGPLVVQYEPPAGATPAETGVLFDQKVHTHEITATIVHLAVKRYLTIEEGEKKGILGSSKTYAFTLDKDYAGDPTLTEHEKAVLRGIFDGGIGSRTELKELENKFYKDIPGIKNAISQAAVGRGWYKANPEKIRAAYFGVGVFYLIFLYWVGYGVIASVLGTGGPTAFVSLGLPGVLIMIFGYFMPARTVSGAEAYGLALGFREYISKAETARIKWEEKENIFEKFLPYAMVFGVVDKWAKAFEGVDLKQPDWYRGGSLNTFSALYFANSLTAATSSISHSLAVSPSSHGGGGGFGGGGGGGGGFGGGGGGSW